MVALNIVQCDNGAWRKLWFELDYYSVNGGRSIVVFILVLPIFTLMLELCTRYFPELCEKKKSQVCYSGGV